MPWKKSGAHTRKPSAACRQGATCGAHKSASKPPLPQARCREPAGTVFHRSSRALHVRLESASDEHCAQLDRAPHKTILRRSARAARAPREWRPGARISCKRDDVPTRRKSGACGPSRCRICRGTPAPRARPRPLPPGTRPRPCRPTRANNYLCCHEGGGGRRAERSAVHKIGRPTAAVARATRSRFVHVRACACAAPKVLINSSATTPSAAM